MATQPKPRVAYEQNGAIKCPRDALGRTLPIDAMQRFIEKCRFDPYTGCVLWTGGTTRGHGNNTIYGSFWFEGRRWYAHRWSAIFVHKLDVGELTVGHCCKHTLNGHPNTLCVEHVTPQTLAENVAECNTRTKTKARQDPSEKQYWLLVQRGYEQLPERVSRLPGTDDFPFFTPPAWLGDLGVASRGTNDCPF